MAYLNKSIPPKQKILNLAKCKCGALYRQISNSQFCKPCRADRENVRLMMASRSKYE